VEGYYQNQVLLHDGWGNVSKNNTVKNFTVDTNGADYYAGPDAHENTAIGICKENGTYYDEGANNIWKCLTNAGAGAAGPLAHFSLRADAHSFRTPLEK
jgi:hypothetical protein